MSSQIQTIISMLTPEQVAAVEIVKLSLDCYNSYDGTGIFSGVQRYQTLCARIEICAVQADNLIKFWSLLLKRMRWPVPPKSDDKKIISVLSVQDGASVLRVLSGETASIVTLARMLHDQDKGDRKEARAAAYGENKTSISDDSLEGLL